MNVLVAGGAGYIGSHTAKALACHGFRPIVIDDLSTGHAHNVKWGPLVQANISDTRTVRSVLNEYNIEAVVHFAGSALVGESAAEPLSYFQNNVGATLSLLDAMRQEKVKNIVFSSTCATYGLPDHALITEDQPQKPINPYGDSKLAVERVLRWMGLAGQLRWLALRYFNAAGADPEGDLGEEHEHETHLIPLAIGAALGQRERLQIFGTDYPTPDGTPIRDYIHVSDLASAHVSALQYLEQGGESQALNLGTGKGASVLEVIRAVEAVGGCSVPIAVAPRRVGDSPTLVAGPERALRFLQWVPCYSTLETIVDTAWRWHSGLQCQTDLHTSSSKVSA
jgi:UDP-arabinose 4-epimerase